MSSVPWTRPLGLCAMKRAPLGCQEEDGIVTLDCQVERMEGRVRRDSVRSAVRSAYSKQSEKDRTDFGYARLVAQGSGGSPGRVGDGHSRRGRGEAGDSGGPEKDCAGCSGAWKCGYRAVGEGVAGDGRGGGRRGNDLRLARCERPGFGSCRIRFSDRRQRPFPQTGKDRTRWPAVHQSGKRRTAEISVAGDGGAAEARTNNFRGGVCVPRRFQVTWLAPKVISRCS